MTTTKMIIIALMILFSITASALAQEIHDAARQGDLEKVKALLKKNPGFVNVKDDTGNTPLSYAVSGNHSEVINLLLDNNVQIPIHAEEGRILLHSAAIGGHKRLVRLMIKKGIDSTTKNNNGGTLLHSAATGGLADAAEMLIAKGMDVNEKNRYGLTPLYLAALKGHENILRLLIKKGADVNLSTFVRKTALQFASENNLEVIVKLLIENGANDDPGEFPVFKDKYFDQKRPTMKPELFLLGIISSPDFDHGSPVYSPDMKEIYWSNWDINGPRGDIFCMKFEDSQWSPPEIASFSTKEFKDCFPAFSFDGKKLYFVSRRPLENSGKGRPYDIWVVNRTRTGWSKPKSIGPQVNSEHYDGGPSLSKEGILYFFSNREGGKGSFDIYRSKLVDGRYTEPENLGDRINTKYMELYSFIAPDESYLIFVSNRPGGFGSIDLYIAFRQQDGSWTKAKNMGDKINSENGENFPWISPDGKYFFFGSDRNRNYDVYWVDAKIILSWPGTFLPFSQDFSQLKGKYLGQTPPGKNPEIFAPGIICLEDRFVQDIAISTDGTEICFVETNNQWNSFKIFYTRQKEDGSWTKPVKAPFLGASARGLRCFFSHDGGRVYYISEWPRNVWVSNRTTNGWSEPVKLDMPISSDKIENSISHSADDRLFFCSHRDGGKGGCDVYFSKIDNGNYTAAQNIEVTNTEYNDCGPVMSPDGKYLVFHSNRPGGYGGADLYVCFNEGTNKWSKPKNMGAGVNTKAFEVIAHFSPDGKYIFFTRRNGIKTEEPSKIYWMSSTIIQTLK